ncbi:P-type conjugative transfer ATPase TrbB [Cupriavidus pauculus]|uniref:P-type conjugative transfer ATPase TrbB n=2 Tax=Cupriavidus pauculus TaxID=82633 RepID=A0A2N5C728_9BURK|nr:P-type conjugative transfer ATPase TrbB [Cupriavidus pauculus]
MEVGKVFNGSQSSSVNPPGVIALDPAVSAMRQALGPLVCAVLDDPDVVEVMLNVDGRLWIERVWTGRAQLDVTLNAKEGERIIRAVASELGVEVHPGQPLLSAVLPGTGDRFDGALPPVASGPAFALRKRVVGVIPLDAYVDGGIMTAAQAECLRRALRERQNILIAGGSGAGKTTLANALLIEMAPLQEGVLVLEDRSELQCTVNHHVSLRTNPGLASMSELVCAAVRLRPDRVVLGEVRGDEALEILKLWNRSRPGGFTTIHAGSAQGALLRLQQMLGPDSDDTSRMIIADTIHLVVYLAGRNNSRRVESLQKLAGYDRNGFRLVDAVVVDAAGGTTGDGADGAAKGGAADAETDADPGDPDPESGN